MTIVNMRRVDYYLGIPLCFIFSWLNKLIPKRKINTILPQKILFLELSEMGSAVLVDPALQRAKLKYSAQLYFVIFKRNKVSLEILKTIPEENIFVIRDESIGKLIFDSFKFFLWCRRKKIEACVDLELFSRASALLSFLTLAQIKSGFQNTNGEGLYRGSFLTHPVNYNSHIHITRNFLALLETTYGPPQSPLLKKHFNNDELKMTKTKISENDQERVRKKIKELYPEFKIKQKIILINPNSSEFLPQRKWPILNYVDLIKLILQNHSEHLILITGSPQERREIETIIKSVSSSRCINFAGEVPFLDLIPLYSISDILITNDSGPGHFSSVTSIKSFVFFGPETPKLYGSLGNSTPLYANLSCSPCVSAYNHRKTNCQDAQCLKALTPAFVYSLIKGNLIDEVKIKNYSNQSCPQEALIPF